MKGLLITFEGIDGSGKTTQIEMCADWLHSWNLPVTLTREPGGTNLGHELRELIMHQPMVSRTELLLFAADRAQHVEGFIKPQLETGAIVLCDRFTDSTVAYQGYGRGIDLQLIQQLNQISTDGLHPDLTIWLDVNLKTAEERIRPRQTSDRIEQADPEFHQRIRTGFAKLADANPQRIVPINASLSKEKVHQEISRAMWDKLAGYVRELHLG